MSKKNVHFNQSYHVVLNNGVIGMHGNGGNDISDQEKGLMTSLDTNRMKLAHQDIMSEKDEVVVSEAIWQHHKDRKLPFRLQDQSTSDLYCQLYFGCFKENVVPL